MKLLRAYKDMEPTYGELAEALRKLHFVDKSNERSFFYVHKKSGAEVLLILKAVSEKVHKAHFASLSWNLEEFGVLQHEHDLGKLIEQMRLTEKQPAA
jgi:hypothetical protein